MAAHLLTWNPEKWSWPSFELDLERSRSGRRCVMSWSTGGVRSIHEGDRLFLLRQSAEPRGILAAGFAVSEVYDDKHYDPNIPQDTTYVDVDFTTILPLEHLMPRAVLDETPLAAMYWSIARSGTEIKPRNDAPGRDELVAALEQKWAEHLAMVGGSVPDPAITNNTVVGIEGTKRLRTHEYKERDRKIVALKKQQAVSQFGELRCEVCGFVFKRVYGCIGQDYIECHHTVPLAQLCEGHRTTLDHLALVCANCHRMLHAGGGVRSVADLKALLLRDLETKANKHVL
jgi:5-methylcytosine-specific restriction protein A